MDCRWGSLVKLCRLMGIKIYNLHISVDRTDTMQVWEWHSQPGLCPVLPATHEAVPCRCCRCRHQLEQGGRWVGKAEIKQAGIWWDHWHWSSCCKCMWWMMQRHLVTDWLSIQCLSNLEANLPPSNLSEPSNDPPWDNYRRSALLRVGLCAFV